MLRLHEVCVDLGGQRIVQDVSLDVEAGEVVALLGPSGCGKTTTLRAIAGLESLSSGSIHLGDRDLGPLPPERRGLGMVFQDGALFPHLDVAGNIGFAADRTRVEELLPLLRLDGLAERGVQDLSGGQRQRVALGRALAPRPPVLLLDEPFASLDPALRGELREDCFALARAAGTTVVVVTHDQDEAAAVGDRIALMREGRLEQVGTPEDLRRRPASRFVLDFIGAAGLLGDEVLCPEDLELADEGELSGSVEAIEVAGGVRIATVRLDEGRLRVVASPGIGIGSDVRLLRRRPGHSMKPISR